MCLSEVDNKERCGASIHFLDEQNFDNPENMLICTYFCQLDKGHEGQHQFKKEGFLIRWDNNKKIVHSTIMSSDKNSDYIKKLTS
jgi:hypothetical protein